MLANIEFYQEEESEIKETKPIKEEANKQETKSSSKSKEDTNEGGIKKDVIDMDKYHHLSLKHEITNYKISL